MKTNFTFKSSSGKDISAVKWLPKDKASAVLIITIGMVEHCRRYDAFAGALTEQGIAVYSHDHIGHGKTETNTENIGHLTKGDYKHMLADMVHMNKIARENHPGVPVILMGHSMGSMLSRVYLKKYVDSIDGIILSGTSGSMPERGVLSLIAKTGRLFGEKRKANFIYNMSFKAYAKSFEGEDVSRWLSSIEENYKAYSDDPMCGQVCTFGFYSELADMFRDAMNFNDIDKLDKKIPMYIGVGEFDKFAAQPELVEGKYEDAGFIDIDFKKYPGSRHEIVNDICSAEFTDDILSFVKLVL